MNTKIKAGMAALLAVGSIAASAAPADAYGYWGGHGGYYGHGWGGHGYGGGALIGAGIAGLAVGAALAGPHYGYARPYYGPAYYGYGACAVRRSVWDPYYGGYVVRRVPVPC